MITTAFYDPAVSEKSKADYKAIVVGSMLAGRYYVRYAWIKHKKTAQDVLTELYRIDADFPGVIQGFEKNGFQVLYQELLKNKAEKMGYPITIQGLTSVGNKYTRIESLAGFVEDGSIIFQRDEKGYGSDIGLLVEQLQEFPHAAHDDGPDALYYAFNMARMRARRMNWRHLETGRARQTSELHAEYTNFSEWC